MYIFSHPYVITYHSPLTAHIIAPPPQCIPTLSVDLHSQGLDQRASTSSHHIGGEKIFGPKDFTLGFGSKVRIKWKGANVISPSCQISTILTQENTPPSLRNQYSSLGLILSPRVRSITGYFGPQVSWTRGIKVHHGVFWTPSFLDTGD